MKNQHSLKGYLIDASNALKNEGVFPTINYQGKCNSIHSCINGISQNSILSKQTWKDLSSCRKTMSHNTQIPTSSLGFCRHLPNVDEVNHRKLLLVAQLGSRRPIKGLLYNFAAYTARVFFLIFLLHSNRCPDRATIL